MTPRTILALDQGTSSSRAILFDAEARPLATAQREVASIFPSPGHVEQDPEEIWESQLAVAREALSRGEAAVDAVAALGVTNQRETTVFWERATGRPVANAIVWQSRVTAPVCERLRSEGVEELVRERTGLLLDPYFSATKIRYLLDTIPGLARRAEAGEVLFGTVDSFLIWRLTGGRAHVTDVSNASRTLLLDLRRLDWDDELLSIFGIPRAMLPEVRSSSEIYGETDRALFGRSIPIAAAAGDQQAATFGQACFEKGTAKNTYGTGCFLLLNTGEEPVRSEHRLLTTVGWKIGGRTTYCLEGSVFIGGAVVSWLRDRLRAIASSSEIERLAATVPDSAGVYFVPAFVGLGAPYWDPYARGTIVGMTRDTGIGHLARAALESMAYQTRDVLDAMREDSGIALTSVAVDGGAAGNDLLLQFQADVLGIPLERPVVSETTALGAAYLAGLSVGVWESLDEIAGRWTLDREFVPAMDAARREELYRGWKRAVSRARDWVEH